MVVAYGLLPSFSALTESISGCPSPLLHFILIDTKSEKQTKNKSLLKLFQK